VFFKPFIEVLPHSFFLLHRGIEVESLLVAGVEDPLLQTPTDPQFLLPFLGGTIRQRETYFYKPSKTPSDTLSPTRRVLPFLLSLLVFVFII